MYSNKLYTPLRYPGGKAVFAPVIARLMEENSIVGGHYAEPFCGGAGVALELLYHDTAAQVHINDLDPAVYAFWKAATEEPERLLRLLHDTPVTMDEWLKWRSVLRDELDADFVERGFATLFLNRTNRSGILKGGVIGGLMQTGPYKLDARFKKEQIAGRIDRVARNASRIKVYCEDALKFLRQAKYRMPSSSLLYLDPPYFVKGQGLYRNYYKPEDHLAIASEVQRSDFGLHWVVSYDNAEQIRDMYSASRAVTYGLNYTAQARYVGSEVMFFSPDLLVPEGLPSMLKRAA